MKKNVLLMLAVILVLALAACGTERNKAEAGDKEQDAEAGGSQQSEQPAAIEVTDASGETIVFGNTPASIAALNSGDLNILLALGADVTGRPTANGPVAKELENITEIGNPHQPNFEKIAEVHPDVLAASMSFKQHAANVERQGTKVVYTKADSIADIQKTITLFGQLFQKEAQAEKINKTIDGKVKEAEKAQAESVKTLLVYGAPGTYLAALPNSLSGDLLEKAGGENIASDFPKEENYPQYASLSVEKIIERNPQAVMLITHGEPESVKAAFEGEMEKNPAWKNLDAVKNGNVVVLPSHLFGTNPGVNVTDALDVMIESLVAVK